MRWLSQRGDKHRNTRFCSPCSVGEKNVADEQVLLVANMRQIT